MNECWSSFDGVAISSSHPEHENRNAGNDEDKQEQSQEPNHGQAGITRFGFVNVVVQDLVPREG